MGETTDLDERTNELARMLMVSNRENNVPGSRTYTRYIGKNGRITEEVTHTQPNSYSYEMITKAYDELAQELVKGSAQAPEINTLADRVLFTIRSALKETELGRKLYREECEELRGMRNWNLFTMYRHYVSEAYAEDSANSLRLKYSFKEFFSLVGTLLQSSELKILPDKTEIIYSNNPANVQGPSN